MMKHVIAICLIIGLCCWSCSRPRLANDTMFRQAPSAPPPLTNSQTGTTPVQPYKPVASSPATHIAEIELVPVDGTRLPARSSSTAPRRYTVRRGDTLAKISQRFYGSTRYWKRIWEHNSQLISSPEKLKHGTVITIP